MASIEMPNTPYKGKGARYDFRMVIAWGQVTRAEVLRALVS